MKKHWLKCELKPEFYLRTMTKHQYKETSRWLRMCRNRIEEEVEAETDDAIMYLMNKELK